MYRYIFWDYIIVSAKKGFGNNEKNYIIINCSHCMAMRNFWIWRGNFSRYMRYIRT
jgi:hypothetical protein